VKNLADRDFLSGLMFMAFGLLGLALSSRYDFGTTRSPGPGFFPIVLSTLLFFIGAGVALKGFLLAADRIERLYGLPLISIPLAVVLFALSIDRLGMVIAVFVAAMVATFARWGYGVRSRLLVATGLASFSALLFIVALRLPIPLWPA